MAEFEVERVGGELKRFGVEGSDVPFKVVSPYDPAGSQPKAIESLVQGVRDGDRYQVLLGVTGSGKTFTMAKTIEALGKPTLVMAPNKTLAAQLASELKEFFPNNAVVYFVSYYDYYQPEAYVPQSDTYIEKDSSINEEVEMLRHQATASLLSRRDVIVVASVSCIYGIGSPEDYAGLAPNVDKKVPLERDDFIHALIDIQYDRNNQTYRMLIAVCRFVIKGLLQTTADGSTKIMDYADDQTMAKLYEKFILGYYQREHPELKAYSPQIAWQVTDGYRTLLPTMQSDIVITNKAAKKTLIIDAKYYTHNMQMKAPYMTQTLHSGNLYQIFTYVKNWSAAPDEVVSGMLLYAGTDDAIQPNNDYQMSGNQISVKTLDMDCDFSKIAAQLDSIADRIK